MIGGRFWAVHLLELFAVLGVAFPRCSVATAPDVILRVVPSATSAHLEANDGNHTDEALLEIHAKRALFGSREDLTGQLVHAPSYDMYLCEHFNGERNETVPPYPLPDHSTIMLTPRGMCTFERKAYAAKTYYGARGVLIYDSLSARYRWNRTSDEVIYPVAQLDYECDQGSGMVSNLALDPPEYNGTELDPLLDMTLPTSVCNLSMARQPCQSQLCVVTSHVENSTDYPVCCAWDVPVTMEHAEDAADKDTDDIVAVFLTIRQAEAVVQTRLFGGQATISSRSGSSFFNVSYIFMWMLGTAVTVFASWYAAASYRRFGVKLAAFEAKKRASLDRRHSSLGDTTRAETQGPAADANDGETRDSSEQHELESAESAESNFNDEEQPRTVASESSPTGKKKGARPTRGLRSLSLHTNQPQKSQGKKHKKKNQPERWTLHSLPPPERKKKKGRRSLDLEASAQLNPPPPIRVGDQRVVTSRNGRAAVDEDSEDTPPPTRESATISAFEMNQYHVVVFIAVASLLLVLLFFFQFYTVIFVIYAIGCSGAVSYLVFNPLVLWFIPKLGEAWVEEFNKPVMCRYNGFDVTSQLIAYTWAAIWIWYGLTHYSPQTNAFFWLTMDVFGACFCILSMSMLKLNSIKIATMLMVAIFLYDIFFVFITPYLTGGDSVMLTVAGGGEGSDDYCSKYPDDSQCTGINFLPMLLILPKVKNYANGSVILGLGDVVLPGFLIAFCARYDEASRLLGVHMTNSGIPVPTKWYEGYFFPMSVAYSVGLLLAFVAVILMEQGQPALLYICPICLVVMFVMGRNRLKDLWSGAKVFKLSDQLINKNEREWGKLRMKRFVEKRRRETLSLEADVSAEDVITTVAQRGPDDIIADDGPQLRRSQQGRGRGRPGRGALGRGGQGKGLGRLGPGSDPSSRIGLTNANTVESMPNQEIPTPSLEPSPTLEPSLKDICFGNETHAGTVEFRRIVKIEAAARGANEEFRPDIFKSIRMKLKGRRFFKMGQSNEWLEASRLEIRKHVGEAYDRERIYIS